MNIETVSQRFRSVRCFVLEIFEEMFYSNLLRLCMWTPCLSPSEGNTEIPGGGGELPYKKGRDGSNWLDLISVITN